MAKQPKKSFQSGKSAKKQRQALLFLLFLVSLSKIIWLWNQPDHLLLGSDGENYFSGLEGLVKDGLLSQSGTLHYWPAGYPLLILLLSFLGKSWVLTTLAIVQSGIFSLSAYLFANQIAKTKIKKYSFLVFILILINPTLSLSSMVIGYESLATSGFLIVVALIISDLVKEKNNLFLFYFAINSSIIGVIAFMQPRMLVPGILINSLWCNLGSKSPSTHFSHLLEL